MDKIIIQGGNRLKGEVDVSGSKNAVLPIMADNAPEMWLMYYKWNLRSVSNTLLDYGVHVQGMTQAQAMDLLVRQSFQNPAEAIEKWRRVQLSSVQLTSYFSGYSEIMELREQRKQALGARFVLRDFHEQFLSYGNAPVKVIRELMQ